MSLGVETRSQSAQQAAAENADLMAKVMNALKQLGLTEDDLSISGYNVYSYQQTPAVIPGRTHYFLCSANRLEITMRDLEAVGEIIDAAIGAGANQIQSVRFDIRTAGYAASGTRKCHQAGKNEGRSNGKAAGVTLGGIKVITGKHSLCTLHRYCGAEAFAVPEAKTQITLVMSKYQPTSAEFWF